MAINTIQDAANAIQQLRTAGESALNQLANRIVAGKEANNDKFIFLLNLINEYLTENGKPAFMKGFDPSRRTNNPLGLVRSKLILKMDGSETVYDPRDAENKEVDLAAVSLPSWDVLTKVSGPKVGTSPDPEGLNYLFGYRALNSTEDENVAFLMNIPMANAGAGGHGLMSQGFYVWLRNLIYDENGDQRTNIVLSIDEKMDGNNQVLTITNYDPETNAVSTQEITIVGGGGGEPGQPGEPGKDGESAYKIAVNNGFVGNEEEWLASLKGEPGEPGKDGTNGNDGQDGTNGYTPEIGENGNWWINGEDTGLPSRGIQGEPGNDGQDGQDGKDGSTTDIDSFTISQTDLTPDVNEVVESANTGTGWIKSLAAKINGIILNLLPSLRNYIEMVEEDFASRTMSLQSRIDVLESASGGPSGFHSRTFWLDNFPSFNSISPNWLTVTSGNLTQTIANGTYQTGQEWNQNRASHHAILQMPSGGSASFEFKDDRWPSSTDITTTQDGFVGFEFILAQQSSNNQRIDSFGFEWEAFDVNGVSLGKKTERANIEKIGVYQSSSLPGLRQQSNIVLGAGVKVDKIRFTATADNPASWNNYLNWHLFIGAVHIGVR